MKVVAFSPKCERYLLPVELIPRSRAVWRRSNEALSIMTIPRSGEFSPALIFGPLAQFLHYALMRIIHISDTRCPH